MKPVRPLLKWVGGKRQLLPQLRRFYPNAFGRYIEPLMAIFAAVGIDGVWSRLSAGAGDQTPESQTSC